MTVELLNAEELKGLYKQHGLFACTCYNTSDEYAEKVGRSCVSSGHMSGSRTEYFKFRIIDVDRGTAEQMMRHEIGTDYEFNTYSHQNKIDLMYDENPTNIVKNMQSFRYVDKNKFEYAIPSTIRNIPAANKLYRKEMKQIDEVRKRIKEILMEHGIDKKKAIEDSNFLLPRATTLTLTIGFTPEALIHFMHKRLCSRAQNEIRRVAIEMKTRVREISPEFADMLVPHCQYLLWCPEENGCGAYPSKKELLKKLEEREEKR